MTTSRLQRLIVATALVSAASMGVGSASAATFDPLPDLTDPQFNALLANGLFAEDFIAESRSGRPGPGDFELNIQEVEPPGPGGSPNPTAQFLWSSGQPVSFELKYENSEVTYTVGGIVLSQTNVQDLPFLDTIYIRTRSNDDGSVVELSNLAIDGMDYNGVVRSDNNDSIDYLKISDIGNSFTLTGQSTFSWTTPDIPQGSRLAYQIKVGAAAKPVPEPLTILGTVAAVGMGLGMKRKLSKADSDIV